MNKVFSNKKTIMLFVLPTFILYVCFCLVPIFYNLYISLFRTNLMGQGTYIGFDNYLALLKDRIFKKSVLNNLKLVAGSLIAHLPLALIFGNAVHMRIRGGRFFQFSFYLPVVICGAAVGQLFKLVYHVDFGLVNSFLRAVGMEQTCKAWLSNQQTVMYALIVVVMWRYLGYHMVIQLGAMRRIPESLYEAAEIDGATSFQQFRLITFPLIKYILGIDSVLIITGSLKYYDIIASMTGGRPNHASEVMSTYMFSTGFRNLKFGYASAIGFVLLLMCMVVVQLTKYIFRSEVYEY